MASVSAGKHWEKKKHFLSITIFKRQRQKYRLKSQNGISYDINRRLDSSAVSPSPIWMFLSSWECIHTFNKHVDLAEDGNYLSPLKGRLILKQCDPHPLRGTTLNTLTNNYSFYLWAVCRGRCDRRHLCLISVVFRAFALTPAKQRQQGAQLRHRDGAVVSVTGQQVLKNLSRWLGLAFLLASHPADWAEEHGHGQHQDWLGAEEGDRHTDPAMRGPDGHDFFNRWRVISAGREAKEEIALKIKSNVAFSNQHFKPCWALPQTFKALQKTVSTPAYMITLVWLDNYDK